MKLRTYLAIGASCCSIMIAATQAGAQATRTFVSGVGDDFNPCSRTAPCKTFSGAINKTAAGGEINCLDPGGFGAVTITKSITIDCEGTMGSALASSTTGVLLNAAGIIVTLRNLNINGGTPALPGVNGIRYLSAARLNVENVRIFNFASASAGNANGISINPTSGGSHRVHVSNSVIRNNGTASQGSAIRVAPTGAAAVQLSLENVEMTGNFRGIDVVATGTSAGNTVTITGGAIFNSTDNAINGATNANALNLMVNDVTFSNNLRGIVLAGAGAQARVGESRITQNGTAVAVSGGAVVQSYKNNQIDFNTNNSTPLPAATPE